jgi:hypothetical protein
MVSAHEHLFGIEPYPRHIKRTANCTERGAFAWLAIRPKSLDVAAVTVR